ncbi:hypothetical protein FIBSPDRAFT_960704 [Athelia psychrophila]|uniref:Uncharacterized protein n=1 Tax=Athelia psychrophila TaxID=1759441 RepID=A0A166C4U3_9AGAM|nr:hypothetical protein FIBSPDRAFT_960704 [Fibularhizoctonia sp. CBS 109695]
MQYTLRASRSSASLHQRPRFRTIFNPARAGSQCRTNPRAPAPTTHHQLGMRTVPNVHPAPPQPTHSHTPPSPCHPPSSAQLLCSPTSALPTVLPTHHPPHAGSIPLHVLIPALGPLTCAQRTTSRSDAGASTTSTRPHTPSQPRTTTTLVQLHVPAAAHVRTAQPARVAHTGAARTPSPCMVTQPRSLSPHSRAPHVRAVHWPHDLTPAP